MFSPRFKSYEAPAATSKTFFTKKGLTKRTVLHELCHHLIDAKGLEIPVRKEEKEANIYARVPEKTAT